MQTYMSETNKVLHNIQNSITKHEADKNVCISDCNTINSLRCTINSYKSEADNIISDLNNFVTDFKLFQTVYSKMVNNLRTECSQLSEQLKQHMIQSKHNVQPMIFIMIVYFNINLK